MKENIIESFEDVWVYDGWGFGWNAYFTENKYIFQLLRLFINDWQDHNI